MLTAETVFAQLRAGAEEHLRKHRRKAVAAAYLDLMREMVGE